MLRLACGNPPPCIRLNEKLSSSELIYGASPSLTCSCFQPAWERMSGTMLREACGNPPPCIRLNEKLSSSVLIYDASPPLTCSCF